MSHLLQDLKLFLLAASRLCYKMLYSDLRPNFNRLSPLEPVLVGVRGEAVNPKGVCRVASGRWPPFTLSEI